MTKKIIIFGCNRGIGLELVKHYLKHDWQVFAICRNRSEQLTNTQAHIFDGVDVTDLNALENLATKLQDHRFDLLIHNAGIWSDENLLNATNDDFKNMLHTFEVNSIAPLKVVKSFTPLLNPNAKIGLMSSRMGSIADNDSGSRYSYRMSKCALNCAGKSLAIDLAPNKIAVAILHPGFVRTDMTNHQGLINPDESAAGIFQVMEKVSIENSGKFWHSNGEELPW
jgi:NAD(P)-dependent dehydrogenase (short-subunit alcohol dehydrogenase family)